MSANKESNKGEIAIIDGYSFVFRTYYSMPSLLSEKGKTPIGATLGFINMLLKIRKDLTNITHIVVIFDAGQKSFRSDISPEYKANRPKAPDELIVQFPIIREAVSAMGIAHTEEVGLEADDLIAHYTKKAIESQYKVTILTSDKDIMQLVKNDQVTIWDSSKNMHYTEEGVFKKYGVYPNQIVDYLSLVGDTSDNVKGAKGIGVKTATSLLEQFKTVENIYQNLDSIKPERVAKLLKEGQESVELAKKLVTFELNTEHSKDLSDFEIKNYDFETLLAFLYKHELKSVISRIGTDYKIDISSYLSTNGNQPEDLFTLANKDSNPEARRGIQDEKNIEVIHITTAEELEKIVQALHKKMNDISIAIHEEYILISPKINNSTEETVYHVKLLNN